MKVTSQAEKNFIEEHFSIKDLVKAGILSKEIRKDYNSISKRFCEFLGLKSICEYGAVEVRCHLTLPTRTSIDNKGELKVEPFITEIKSIYE